MHVRALKSHLCPISFYRMDKTKTDPVLKELLTLIKKLSKRSQPRARPTCSKDAGMSQVPEESLTEEGEQFSFQQRTLASPGHKEHSRLIAEHRSRHARSPHPGTVSVMNMLYDSLWGSDRSFSAAGLMNLHSLITPEWQGAGALPLA